MLDNFGRLELQRLGLPEVVGKGDTALGQDNLLAWGNLGIRIGGSLRASDHFHVQANILRPRMVVNETPSIVMARIPLLVQVARVARLQLVRLQELPHPSQHVPHLKVVHVYFGPKAVCFHTCVGANNNGESFWRTEKRTEKRTKRTAKDYEAFVVREVFQGKVHMDCSPLQEPTVLRTWDCIYNCFHSTLQGSVNFLEV